MKAIEIQCDNSPKGGQMKARIVPTYAIGGAMTIRDLKDAYEILGNCIDTCIDLNEWPAVEILIHARIHVHDMMRFL